MCAMSKAADNPTFTLIHVISEPDIRVGAYPNVKRLIYDVNVINVFHRKKCI